MPGLLCTPLSLFLGTAAHVLGLLRRLVLFAPARTFLGRLPGLFCGLQACPFLGPAPFDVGLHAGFFLRPTPVEQVQAVAEAGESMPPKSTYFFPKIPTGLVFNLLE